MHLIFFYNNHTFCFLVSFAQYELAEDFSKSFHFTLCLIIPYFYMNGFVIFYTFHNNNKTQQRLSIISGPNTILSSILFFTFISYYTQSEDSKPPFYHFVLESQLIGNIQLNLYKLYYYKSLDMNIFLLLLPYSQDCLFPISM